MFPLLYLISKALLRTAMLIWQIFQNLIVSCISALKLIAQVAFLIYKLIAQN
jgi:hypothetical protein